VNFTIAKICLVIGLLGIAYVNGKKFGIAEQAMVTHRVQAEYDAYRLEQESAMNELQAKANEQVAIADMASIKKSATITKIVTQFVDRPPEPTECFLSSPAIKTLNELIAIP
jgi:hypothetical protein